jgi:hypothetical protein
VDKLLDDLVKDLMYVAGEFNTDEKRNIRAMFERTLIKHGIRNINISMKCDTVK